MAQAAGALLATMEQLAGVIVVAPAAILSLVAVTKTLQVAFAGVGEAISAVASGDIEAITEAMDALSPAAQQTVRQLNGVIQGFSDLGNTIQESFFAGLADTVEQFGEAALNVAQQNLPRLSAALSDVAEGFLSAATNSNLFEGVDAVLKQTTAGVAGLQGPLTRLAPAFGDVFLIGSQYIDRMYDALGNVIDRFSEFVTVSAANGDLQRWVEDALEGFRQLGRIAGNLGGVFSSITGSANAAGVGILDSLERISGALDDAFASDRGQNLLAASFGLLSAVTESLAIILPPVVELLAVFITSVADGLTAALQAAQPLLQSFADLLGNFADSLPDTADSFSELADNGVSVFSDALDKLIPILSEFVGTLSGLFTGFDSAWLNDFSEGLQDLGSSLGSGILDVLDSLVGAFAALSFELPTLLPILGDVAEATGGVLATALDQAAASVTPLTDALEDLAPVLDPLENTFSGIAEITGTLVAALAPLVGAVGFIAAGIGQVLNPVVDQLRENFQKIKPDLVAITETLGTALKNAFENLRPGLEAFVEIAGRILSVVTVILPALRGLIELFAPLLEVIGLVAGKILEFLAPALSGLATVLTTLLELFFEHIVPIFIEFANILVDMVGPALSGLWEIASTVFGALTDAFFALMEANQAVWDAIVGYIQTSIDGIVAIFEMITGVLGGWFSDAWSGFRDFVSGIWDSIWNKIVDIVNAIVNFFTGDAASNLAGAIGDAFQGMLNTAVSWLNAIVDSVSSTVENVIQFFRDLPGNIISAVGDVASSLWNLGKDIIQGLLNGIIEKAKDIPGMIKDAVVDPIKDAITGFKGFLTGSPSKLTTQYGEWISQGLANGIGNAESEVVRAAESLTKSAALPGLDMDKSPVGTTGVAPYGNVLPAAPAAAGSGGALFGPGSIQVVFNGATPSEREAYATGAAVGAGIADELSRRDARVAVGVL